MTVITTEAKDKIEGNFCDNQAWRMITMKVMIVN
jgi:hypothetical protein